MKVSILLLVAFVGTLISQSEAVPRDVGPIPKCNCNGLQCDCCMGFKYMKNSQNICLNTDYNPQELVMNWQLSSNGNVIANRTMGPDAVPICIPSMPLTVCINARNVNFSPTAAKVCAGVAVKAGPVNIYRGTLPCLNLVDGQFTVSKN